MILLKKLGTMGDAQGAAGGKDRMRLIMGLGRTLGAVIA